MESTKKVKKALFSSDDESEENINEDIIHKKIK
jgi:hypothetical protein